MKRLAITFLLLSLLTGIALAWLHHIRPDKGLSVRQPPPQPAVRTNGSQPPSKIKSKVLAARAFVKKNHYNREFCFLIDLEMPSGQKRFFIYDLQKDSVLNSGLVTHGNCNQYWLEGRKYGNTVGCGCSSPGKYKVGNPYHGRFGLAFKLHGLDATNDKAFARYVVLHSHSCVPETEVDDEICQSNGCPTVSPLFLKDLELLIKGSKKPVLLWIVN